MLGSPRLTDARLAGEPDRHAPLSLHATAENGIRASKQSVITEDEDVRAEGKEK